MGPPGYLSRISLLLGLKYLSILNGVITAACPLTSEEAPVSSCIKPVCNARSNSSLVIVATIVPDD